MVSLTTFEAPLLRLILCGGGGLAPAYGPLFGPRTGDMEQARFIWDSEGIALLDGDDESVYGLLDAGRDLDGWLMPLDASPWPARLALVAAYLTWLATSPKVIISPPAFDMIAASVDQVFDEWEKGQVIALTRFAHRGPLPSVHEWRWGARRGFCWGNGPRLPTIPTHLAAHPPVVALPLALFDVPEIRVRVEAL